MEPAKRGPGRPPKIQPAMSKEPTAVELMADLKEQVRVIADGPKASSFVEFRERLKRVSEIGSGDCVQLVWQYASDNAEWKRRLSRELEEYKDAAGRRWTRLLERAAEERRLVIVAERERSDQAGLRRK